MTNSLEKYIELIPGLRFLSIFKISFFDYQIYQVAE